MSAKSDNTTEAHLSHLREEGWCVIKDVIPQDQVDGIRHAAEAINEEATEAYKNEDRNVISYLQPFAPHLADGRVLGIIKRVFNHSHVRIARTQIRVLPPYTGGDVHLDAESAGKPIRSYHSDWPHDLHDLSGSGRIHQPFPDTVMALTTLWMLSSFTNENGGTWIVPQSHHNTRNPRGDDGIDPAQPIRTERQVTGSAGSVFMMDSRIWHTVAPNQSDYSRVAVLASYIPWWMSVELGKANQVTIPVDVFNTFPENVKPLFQHRVMA